jgi:hypothetical protein
LRKKIKNKKLGGKYEAIGLYGNTFGESEFTGMGLKIKNFSGDGALFSHCDGV